MRNGSDNTAFHVGIAGVCITITRLDDWPWTLVCLVSFMVTDHRPRRRSILFAGAS